MNTRLWSPLRVQSWIDHRIGALPSRHRRRSRPSVGGGRVELTDRIADYYLNLPYERVPRSAVGWWERLQGRHGRPDDPEPFSASWIDTAAERRQRAIAQATKAEGVLSELGTGARYGVGWGR